MQDTIAKEADFEFGKTLKIMAYHHSKDTEKNAEHCIGWLSNQLGRGNNIQLRLRFLFCDNISELKVAGEQHIQFSDTLPKTRYADKQD